MHVSQVKFPCLASFIPKKSGFLSFLLDLEKPGCPCGKMTHGMSQDHIQTAP